MKDEHEFEREIGWIKNDIKIRSESAAELLKRHGRRIDMIEENARALKNAVDLLLDHLKLGIAEGDSVRPRRIVEEGTQKE